ncbi:hypothetical protein [Flavivirga sp. 57AJ16]|uniref:hypothetical protein n=1 Tax=Flavivirga sp. 57AJ16 TaxID=3025307 RepID=UPI0023663463|nr:hypothetical protein [Flavivirga sp. 57AJ16]MDD7887323.1 hypothetical protein [Flavivirga sp. 57AJ16]
MKKYFLFLVFIFFFNCNSNDNSDLSDEDILIEGVGIMFTENTKYPLLIQHQNGERFLTMDNDENNNIDAIIFSNGDVSMISELDESTLLPSVTTFSDGTMIVYSFKEDNTIMDIGIIDPNQNIEYVRDIEISLPSRTTNKKYYNSKSSSSNLKSLDALESVKIALFAIKIGINVPLCLGSLASAQVHIAALACSSAISDTLSFLEEQLGFQSEALTKLTYQLNNLTTTIAGLSDVFECAEGVIKRNPAKALECINATLTGIDLLIDKMNETKDINDEAVELVEDSLQAGSERYAWKISWNPSSCGSIPNAPFGSTYSIYIWLDENRNFIPQFTEKDNFVNLDKYKVNKTGNTLSIHVRYYEINETTNNIVEIESELIVNFDTQNTGTATIYKSCHSRLGGCFNYCNGTAEKQL